MGLFAQKRFLVQRDQGRFLAGELFFKDLEDGFGLHNAGAPHHFAQHHHVGYLVVAQLGGAGGQIDGYGGRGTLLVLPIVGLVTDLVMAIVGGALMPPLQGWVIDQQVIMGHPAVNVSFVLPLICFLIIICYGYRAYKKGIVIKTTN